MCCVCVCFCVFFCAVGFDLFPVMLSFVLRNLFVVFFKCVLFVAMIHVVACCWCLYGFCMLVCVVCLTGFQCCCFCVA